MPATRGEARAGGSDASSARGTRHRVNITLGPIFGSPRPQSHVSADIFAVFVFFWCFFVVFWGGLSSAAARTPGPVTNSEQDRPWRLHLACSESRGRRARGWGEGESRGFLCGCQWRLRRAQARTAAAWLPLAPPPSTKGLARSQRASRRLGRWRACGRAGGRLGRGCGSRTV